MAQKDYSLYVLTLEIKPCIFPLPLIEFLDQLISEENLYKNHIKNVQKTSDKENPISNLSSALVIRYDIINNIHCLATKIEKALKILTKIVTEKKSYIIKCKKNIILAKIGEEIIKKILKTSLLKHFKKFVSQINFIKIQKLTYIVTNLSIALSKVVNRRQELYKKYAKIIISAKINDTILRRILMKNYMKKFITAIADIFLIKHFYKTFIEIAEIKAENDFLDEILRKVIKSTKKANFNQNKMINEDIVAHIQELSEKNNTKKVNKNLIRKISKDYNTLLVSNHKNSQELLEIQSKKIKLQQAYNEIIKKIEKTHHEKLKLESETKEKTFLLDACNKTKQDLENQSEKLSESILSIRSDLGTQKNNELKLITANEEYKKQKLHNIFLTEKLVNTEKNYKELQLNNQNLKLTINSLKHQRENNMRIIAQRRKKVKKNEENKNIDKNSEAEILTEPSKYINSIRNHSPCVNISTKPLGPINLPLSLSPIRNRSPVVTSRQSFIMKKNSGLSDNKLSTCNNAYNQNQVTAYSWSLVLLLVLFIILLIVY
ncbi:hypothetical protein SteCoe_5788 [Stentor coeruleus]|uniref:Uncharacterized protein n=1 Tax=Stentor coeruleus TaxID=5963 RepID=A0A1R2CRK1_9CILI|nr:hypothetical protein SteCoe_5788 [Stentor coeruleus]